MHFKLEKISKAAVAFASDYGPLPAARDGDENAQLVMANRLMDQLRKQGLTIKLLPTE